MNRKKFLALRLVAVALLLCLALPLFSACKSRAIPAGKLALTSVGTVDGRDVLYEELYFLVSGYLPALQQKHGNDLDALQDELSTLIQENIVSNTAMIRLCEKNGLTYDEKALSNDVQTYVDSLIESSFEGKRGDYRDSLSESGLTDHYLRFTAAVDALYAKLPAIYSADGRIPVSDEEIRTYVENNFVRVWHVAIMVDEGETVDSCRLLANVARMRLENGETVYDLIRDGVSEDYGAGEYYFPRGTMEQSYEDAAFALELNELSPVVESTAISNRTGERVPAFYVMERLPLEASYINKNMTELSDQCRDAIIASDLDATAKTLSFTPNEFYDSLNLTDLEAPKSGFDYLLWLPIGGGILLVAAAVVTPVVIRKRRASKRAA